MCPGAVSSSCLVLTLCSMPFYFPGSSLTKDTETNSLSKEHFSELDGSMLISQITDTSRNLDAFQLLHSLDLKVKIQMFYPIMLIMIMAASFRTAEWITYLHFNML